jgi:hypothetical protein
MSFNATNFTVSILLLMVLTLFIAGVRICKPVESNWVFFYWVLVTAVTITNPQLYNFRVIAVGLAAGLLTRFEFMNLAVTRFVLVIEMCIWAYIIYMSWLIVSSF